MQGLLTFCNHVTRKVNLIAILIFAVIDACIFYVLLETADGKLTWMPLKAFVYFLNGICQVLLMGYLMFKRPNKIIKY